MQTLYTKELIPHPRNSEFFDDIEGEKWTEFLESIKTSGVIEPIICTQDLIVVSGHQRLRACTEIGIQKVSVEVRHYDSEDKILKDLIETNIRQRGSVGGSQMKLGRRIAELERIYGVKHGGKRSNGPVEMTQEDLAKKLGIDANALKRAKRLTTLPPELQQAVEDGKISASLASRTIASMPESEQLAIIKQLPASGKLTGEDIEKLRREVREQADYIKALEEREPQTVVKEVVPEDYEELKSKNKQLESDLKFSRHLSELTQRERKQYLEERNEAREQLKALTKSREEDSEASHIESLKRDAEYFALDIKNFIKRNSGYVWEMTELEKLQDKDRMAFVKAIKMIYEWSSQMINNLGGNLNG